VAADDETESSATTLDTLTDDATEADGTADATETGKTADATETDETGEGETDSTDADRDDGQSGLFDFT
jgi:hypothetical protein